MSRFTRPPTPPPSATATAASLAKLPRLTPLGAEPVRAQRAERLDDGLLHAGVICNPRSHRNRKAEIAHTVPAPDVVLAAPRTHGELAATLTEFAARRISLLVIDGGDGTVRDVLTAAADAFGDDMPQVAILPTGKTNALALDLGVPAGWTLDAAVAAVQTGGIRRRAPVIVRRPGSVDLHGFLFGAGVFVRSTELAQRTHRAGAFNGFAVALVVVWTFLKVLFGGATSDWRRGEPMRIVANGETLADGPTFIVLASTLEALPLGVKPLGAPRPGLKAIVAAAPPRRLVSAMVRAMSGQRGAWLERHGYRHRDFGLAEIEVPGGFILDGELYTGGALALIEGKPIQFVVP